MERAFQKAKRDWMSNPNVNGVFRSLCRVKGQWTDEIGIQFHVKKKVPLDKLSPENVIPVEIDGIRTDVIQANAVPAVTPRKYAAVQGGMSIGAEENYGAGTLGIVMMDSVQGAVGITCAHCILVEGAAIPTPGHPVHPAIEDGGSVGTDRIGTILDYYLEEGGPDVAGIKLDYPYGLSVFNTAVLPMGSRDPSIYDILYKLGRSSGLTEGMVSGFGDILVDYSGWNLGTLTLEMLSIIPAGDNPNELIVVPGDSGSLWYYPDTFEGGGIAVSVAADANITYASLFSTCIGPAGLLNPIIPDEHHSERKGSANFVVPACYEIKGSAILSGSSPIFSTRLTAVNQDTALGYESIEDIYESCGIRFIASGTSPTL